MTTTKTDNEITALEGEGENLTLSSGLEIEVERLKTRQLFKLVKILTSGGGQLLGNLNLSADSNADEFASQLVALAVVAIPEAEDEAIDFIRAMVRPAGLVRSNKLTKKQAEANEQRAYDLYVELENPELDDLITIFEKVIANEAEHIQSLGKRLMSILSVRSSGVEAKTS
jgi:hypothetical protein